MRLLLAALACLAAVITGCSRPNRQVAEISWVDFVRVGGVTYSSHHAQGRALPTDEDLGPPYGVVSHKVAGNVTSPGYRAKDGDAAYLDPGTVLYRLKRYRPEFRLAARREGELVIFEADRNPTARTGADLLDLSGKVTHISIVSAEDDRPLTEIREPDLVNRLVALVEAAPVLAAAEQGGDEERYVLTFHFQDGTASTRVYLPASGRLTAGHPGLRLPTEFAAAIRASPPAGRHTRCPMRCDHPPPPASSHPATHSTPAPPVGCTPRR